MNLENMSKDTPKIPKKVEKTTGLEQTFNEIRFTVRKHKQNLEN